MPTLLEHIAARLAMLHARRVLARFQRTLDNVDTAQQQALMRVLRLVTNSDFGRRYGLAAVRSLADLRRAVPLATYEDYRPTIDRLCDGDTQALFSPGTPILMFATSSGTMALPKRIPVTPDFVADYRRGWNTFGIKMLADHPDAVLRAILQSSGRHDAETTSAGIPCGAITGLLALAQKRIVRRFYVGRPEISHVPDARARYYTLMRLGVVRDVAFAITANPATLIQMARTTDELSETLIRDVHDGTVAPELVSDATLRRTLSTGLRPNPRRAAELTRLRRQHGTLRPRDYWRLSFVACWTGGSLGHYLGRLAEWWGPVPVRDVGLLASEGRVSIPFDDNTPIGVLDVTAGVFEFIPLADADAAHPPTLQFKELEVGRDYVVVLTNTSGLVRYRLDDVVRVHGHLGAAPLVEFLHRAGRVASVAGEKLTENQLVAAVQATCRRLALPEFDFVAAPCWADPPYYRVSATHAEHPALAATLDAELALQNEEYDSRRKSNRLGPLRVRSVSLTSLTTMDARLAAARRSTTEQYKRPCLFPAPGQDDRALDLAQAPDAATAS
ncbi:MAG: GH3 auxin-responsive promoter family protein [Phycisphaerae bacterium]|nr:GH3 auxin-responsive promoter family protein [Phycisphaerae bacterium]